MSSQSKKPQIVPRETKASQLLKLKNKNTNKDSSFDSSITKRRKPVKPKIWIVGEDINKSEFEVKLDESCEEINTEKATPSKRMTMKPGMNPYASNYWRWVLD
jgi:hypothetical protein